MAYILVVDDDASYRALICDLLQEMGYQAAEASNGREALDCLERHLPSAILLDLRMPVMSGWVLLDLLKKMPDTKELPIIVISAYGYEWEAALIGASGYVSKPVDLEEIRATVERVIGPPQPAMLVH